MLFIPSFTKIVKVSHILFVEAVDDWMDKYVHSLIGIYKSIQSYVTQCTRY